MVAWQPGSPPVEGALDVLHVPLREHAVAGRLDARNAGGRYDLIVAAMLTIGLIGLVLDGLIRKLEDFDEVKWGYARRD